MGDKSKIGWLDTYDENDKLSLGASWNAITGCDKISPGCKHCYAEEIADRYGRSFEAQMVPEHLCHPLRWQRPRRIFVASVSDVFHKNFTNEYIAAQFGVMAAAPRHTFLLLTKRAERMLEWFKWVCAAAIARGMPIAAFCFEQAQANCLPDDVKKISSSEVINAARAAEWPLRNLQLGVSAEDQENADKRIPLLLKCPASSYWVSAEPLLGPIDFDMARCEVHDREFIADGINGQYCSECAADGWSGELSYGHWLDPCGGVDQRGINWIVVGGESGARPREMELAWAIHIAQSCKERGVAIYVKQDSGRLPGQQGRLPDALWALKEYPEVEAAQ